ncbi:hypothetical protein SNEBB_004662 [Seison nebaliae]|nr:hypothetical protein SNEBB_004662 [Seison nebaliae]
MRTSCHGINRLNNNISWSEFTFWLIISITGFSLMIFFMEKSFSTYFNEGTVPKISELVKTELEFPQIYICNKNQMYKDNINKRTLTTYQITRTQDFFERMKGFLSAVKLASRSHYFPVIQDILRDENLTYIRLKNEIIAVVYQTILSISGNSTGTAHVMGELMSTNLLYECSIVGASSKYQNVEFYRQCIRNNAIIRIELKGRQIIDKVYSQFVRRMDQSGILQFKMFQSSINLSFVNLSQISTNSSICFDYLRRSRLVTNSLMDDWDEYYENQKVQKTRHVMKRTCEGLLRFALLGTAIGKKWKNNMINYMNYRYIIRNFYDYFPTTLINLVELLVVRMRILMKNVKNNLNYSYKTQRHIPILFTSQFFCSTLPKKEDQNFCFDYHIDVLHCALRITNVLAYSLFNKAEDNANETVFIDQLYDMTKWNLNDNIYYCTFKSAACRLNFFVPVRNQLGLCYALDGIDIKLESMMSYPQLEKLDDWNNFPRQEMPGVRGGLQLLFYTGNGKTIDFDYGVEPLETMLLIRNTKNPFFYPYAFRYLLLTGHYHDIRLKLKKVKKLNTKNFNCSNNMEFDQDYCLYKCTKQIQAEQCNCTFVEPLNSYRNCSNFKDFNCLRQRFRDALAEQFYINSRCSHCNVNQCEYYDYSIDAFNIADLQQNAIEYIYKKYRIRCALAHQVISANGYYFLNISMTAADHEIWYKKHCLSIENFTQKVIFLNIYFDDLTITEETEELEMDHWTLLSSIGNYAGMFLGMSLITVIEIVSNLITLFHAYFNPT